MVVTKELETESFRAVSPKVLVLSFTDTSSEPRVLRQLKTLSDKNIPFAVGSFAPADSHRGSVVSMSFKRGGETSAKWKHLGKKILRVGIRLGIPVLRRLVIKSFLAKRLSFLWFRYEWQEVGLYIEQTSVALERAGFHPNVIVFHDYFTWQLADKLSAALGARKILDSHEHAISQYAQSKIWSFFFAPMVRDIEEHIVRESDAVIVIGEEIRTLLEQQYSSDTKIVVVRSVPDERVDQFRSSSWPIRLLYSGAIGDFRGLEPVVRAMSLVGPGFTLAIKGPVSDARFAAELHSLIAGSNLGDRVTIGPPVPYSQIVLDAANYDVGIFTQENVSPQKANTLPNKFFNYVAAGLALVVSDYPEMGRLSREFGFAVLVREETPTAIADALLGLSPRRVDALKFRSMEAAKKLSWDNEQEVFMKLLDDVCGL